MILLNSTFSCVPKRVPIMKCHWVLSASSCRLLFLLVIFLFLKWMKKFLHLTVHTVHLVIFLFYINHIDGDELVKSEQLTIHLNTSLTVPEHQRNTMVDGV
jgi:hypothetical protein